LGSHLNQTVLKLRSEGWEYWAQARALRVLRPGGRYPVAVRGHDRKAIFRRQSALVNAKSALQRLPGPAASELLSRAAVGNHRPTLAAGSCVILPRPRGRGPVKAWLIRVCWCSFVVASRNQTTKVNIYC